jgi:hypothetical protein
VSTSNNYIGDKMSYQETVPAVTNSTAKQVQAFINAGDDQLGFFTLSNHIEEHQFLEVLKNFNNPEIQMKLVVVEGKNKNGKNSAQIRNPKGQLFGFLSGYSATTLLAIDTGVAVFSDARPVSDVKSMFDF